MRSALSLLALLLASATTSAAEKPPVYLWLEPEWFDGVTGSFGYWTGEAKPTGAWGIAGPGICPGVDAGRRERVELDGRPGGRNEGRLRARPRSCPARGSTACGCATSITARRPSRSR